MKLNASCVRDVLLKIEEMQQFYVNNNGDVEKDDLWLDSLCAALPGYGKEEIFYSLFNLDQAGYVDISVDWADGCVNICAVNYITYEGHEFLDGIRDDKRWSSVKKGLSTIRDYSLSAISSVAEGMTTAAINAYLTQQQ